MAVKKPSVNQEAAEESMMTLITLMAKATENQEGKQQLFRGFRILQGSKLSGKIKLAQELFADGKMAEAKKAFDEACGSLEWCLRNYFRQSAQNFFRKNMVGITSHPQGFPWEDLRNRMEKVVKAIEDYAGLNEEGESQQQEKFDKIDLEHASKLYWEAVRVIDQAAKDARTRRQNRLAREMEETQVTMTAVTSQIRKTDRLIAEAERRAQANGGSHDDKSVKSASKAEAQTEIDPTQAEAERQAAKARAEQEAAKARVNREKRMENLFGDLMAV